MGPTQRGLPDECCIVPWRAMGGAALKQLLPPQTARQQAAVEPPPRARCAHRLERGQRVEELQHLGLGGQGVHRPVPTLTLLLLGPQRSLSRPAGALRWARRLAAVRPRGGRQPAAARRLLVVDNARIAATSRGPIGHAGKELRCAGNATLAGGLRWRLLRFRRPTHQSVNLGAHRRVMAEPGALAPAELRLESRDRLVREHGDILPCVPLIVRTSMRAIHARPARSHSTQQRHRRCMPPRRVSSRSSCQPPSR